ncbi:MAG: hypothetical protein J6D54_01715 [Olsenella sp.]|nr:hypothetical protein [Olsenella sp.]
MGIDIEELRSYLIDLCGTAVFAGMGAAQVDVVEIEDADGEDLCAIAKKLGVDIATFARNRY